jgi:hypothetical protein
MNVIYVETIRPKHNYKLLLLLLLLFPSARASAGAGMIYNSALNVYGLRIPLLMA